MGKAVYRLAIFLLAAVTIGVTPFIYISWKGMREENEERLLAERKLAYQAESLEEELKFKREYYERLLHDEKFAERIIREKLGFADPRDIIFRFEDSTPTTIEDGTMPPQYAPPMPARQSAKAAASLAAEARDGRPRSALDRLFRAESGRPASNSDYEPSFTIDMSAEDAAGEPQDFDENAGEDSAENVPGGPSELRGVEESEHLEIHFENSSSDGGVAKPPKGNKTIRFRSI